MSDFVVRFEGIELSPENEHRVQAAIQKAVVEEISSSDLAAYTPNAAAPIAGSLYYFPIHWRGIIIIDEDQRQTVEAVGKSKLTVRQESI